MVFNFHEPTLHNSLPQVEVTNELMDGWGWLDGRIDGLTNKWINIRIGGLMDEVKRVSKSVNNCTAVITAPAA